MDKLIRKTFAASETKQVGEDRVLVVKISTPNPDRSNDVVLPQGVKLDNYLKNPVVAAFHRYGEPPIGKTLEISANDDGIVAKVQFTPEGVNPTADMLYQLYKDGFMNAWSIGFTANKWSQRGSSYTDGREFQEWELLEYSAVLVPDNAEALTILRSKGFDTDNLVKDVEGKEIETVSKVKNIIVNTDESKITLETEDGKSINFDTESGVNDYVKGLQDTVRELKEGRVLSEKNRNIVTNTTQALKSAIQALEELLEATDKSEPASDGEKSKDSAELNNFLVNIRDGLRKADRGVGLTLRGLNEALKNNLKGGE